mmetsp:Transcript_81941/g.253162  ORF Transcript_81941/g.253162 Transcript_81941/m.253162 type:complete len:236 (+) Transcript_81941:319-1026(+)
MLVVRSSWAFSIMKPPGARMLRKACATMFPNMPAIMSEAMTTSARSSGGQAFAAASSHFRTLAKASRGASPSLDRQDLSLALRLCDRFLTHSSSPSVMRVHRARVAIVMPRRPQPAPTSTTFLPATSWGRRRSSCASTMLADQSWQPVEAKTPSAMGNSRIVIRSSLVSSPYLSSTISFSQSVDIIGSVRQRQRVPRSGHAAQERAEARRCGLWATRTSQPMQPPLPAQAAGWPA